MQNFSDMAWVELRKALRSRMPAATALAAVVMPLGIAFLIFVARHPETAQKLGLLGAKANLTAYAATDWSTYLSVCAQVSAAAGFFLFVLAVSWIFGREFVDGTLKDLLAVPVPRGSIVLAKFGVAMLWSAALNGLIFLVSLGMGALQQLPGGSAGVLLRGTGLVAATAGLTMLLVLPFGLLASLGRGYLLPLGMAVVTIMLANLAVIAGWGERFPWAIAGLYAQGHSALSLLSFAIVLLTGLAGMAATYLWWKYADQSR